MKKLVVALVILIPLNTYAQSSVEQDVLSLSKRKFEWMIHKQLDSLAMILDERLLYVHSNGWVESRNEVLDDIQSGKLTYQSVEIKSATARVYQKNTAIVNGSGKFQVMMNGNSLTIELSYTEVYIRERGKWWLASRHANRMP